MVRYAEDCARTAEADYTNDPGYCLQQTRIWCDIPSKYPDASTAWKNATGKRPGDASHVPRGAPVYWTGGSHGYGHIALSLGNGRVRSTDAGGSGKVATVDIGWVTAHWGLPYAGWADSINGVTIPGLEDEMTEDDWKKLRGIVADEVAGNNVAAAEKVWQRETTVTKPNGDKDEYSMGQTLRETWQKVSKMMQGEGSTYNAHAWSREALALAFLAIVVVAGFFLAVFTFIRNQ